MRQASEEIVIETSGAGLYEFTSAVARFVAESGLSEGVLTLLVQHTSASLTIQENADPAVQRDLQRFFEQIAPETARYEHASEGPDDMPAHIKSALTEVSLSVPVVYSKMALGTWQGIYLFEHRARGHRRRVRVHLMGE